MVVAEVKDLNWSHFEVKKKMEKLVGDISQDKQPLSEEEEAPAVSHGQVQPWDRPLTAVPNCCRLQKGFPGNGSFAAN